MAQEIKTFTSLLKTECTKVIMPIRFWKLADYERFATAQREQNREPNPGEFLENLQ